MKDSMGREIDVENCTFPDEDNPQKDYTHKYVTCADCGTVFVVRKGGIALYCRDCQNKHRGENVSKAAKSKAEKPLPMHVDYQTEEERKRKTAPIETCLVKKRDMSDFPSMSNMIERVQKIQGAIRQGAQQEKHSKIDTLEFISQLYKQICVWCDTDDIGPKDVVDLLRSVTYDLEVIG